VAHGSTNTILGLMADCVRDALVTATAGENYSVQVEPYPVSAPTPPTVDFLIGDTSEGTETRAFGLGGELLFTCRVRVNGSDDVANYELLNDLVDDAGDLSIPAALDADANLNGYVASLEFRDPTGVINYLFGDDTLPGRQFTVMVVRADS
jgi:hypothetical protein